MALSQFVTQSASPFTILLILPIVYLLRTLSRLFFHPLSHVPSPFLSKITSTWLNYHSYQGTECRTIHRLHKIYGPLLRVSPNEIDISDGAALHPIYIERGGFKKAPAYQNFDMDGWHTIFSELDPATRTPRAKAIMNLFATGALRAGSVRIEGCVERMIKRIEEAKKQGGRVDVRRITRAMATETVSSYLFKEGIEALDEKGQSAIAPMVDYFVAFGRFWNLPKWAFDRLVTVIDTIAPDKGANESIAKVDAFLTNLIANTEKGAGTYQGQLLAAGFTPQEVHIQCKDLIFAGTDATGHTIAMAFWYLCRHPTALQRLKSELSSFDSSTGQDPQALPFFQGVIKETLRLGFANPVRFPRVVPRGGWTFKGTVVGCSPYEMHLDPSVFPDPWKWKPERWEAANEEMDRNYIPYGVGNRQCIARNLAGLEIISAIRAVVERGVLEGARTVKEKVEIREWFNSKVEGEKIELVWD